MIKKVSFIVVVAILITSCNNLFKPTKGYIKQIITADVQISWFKGTVARDVIKPDYVTIENIINNDIDTIAFGYNIVDVYMKIDSIIILIDKNKEAGSHYYTNDLIISEYKITYDTIPSTTKYPARRRYYEIK